MRGGWPRGAGKKDAGTGTRALSRDGEPGGGQPAVTTGIATVRRGAPSPLRIQLEAPHYPDFKAFEAPKV